MITETELQHSRRVLRQGIALIAAATLLGTAALIHYGSQPREDYWCTYATRDAAPSIQIVP